MGVQLAVALAARTAPYRTGPYRAVRFAFCRLVHCLVALPLPLLLSSELAVGGCSSWAVGRGGPVARGGCSFGENCGCRCQAVVAAVPVAVAVGRWAVGPLSLRLCLRWQLCLRLQLWSVVVAFESLKKLSVTVAGAVVVL